MLRGRCPRPAPTASAKPSRIGDSTIEKRSVAPRWYTMQSANRQRLDQPSCGEKVRTKSRIYLRPHGIRAGATSPGPRRTFPPVFMMVQEHWGVKRNAACGSAVEGSSARKDWAEVSE